jgi:hypothetical protein
MTAAGRTRDSASAARRTSSPAWRPRRSSLSDPTGLTACPARRRRLPTALVPSAGPSGFRRAGVAPRRALRWQSASHPQRGRHDGRWPKASPEDTRCIQPIGARLDSIDRPVRNEASASIAAQRENWAADESGSAADESGSAGVVRASSTREVLWGGSPNRQGRAPLIDLALRSSFDSGSGRSSTERNS